MYRLTFREQDPLQDGFSDFYFEFISDGETSAEQSIIWQTLYPEPQTTPEFCAQLDTHLPL